MENFNEVGSAIGVLTIFSSTTLLEASTVCFELIV